MTRRQQFYAMCIGGPLAGRHIVHEAPTYKHLRSEDMRPPSLSDSRPTSEDVTVVVDVYRFRPRFLRCAAKNGDRHDFDAWVHTSVGEELPEIFQELMDGYYRPSNTKSAW